MLHNSISKVADMWSLYCGRLNTKEKPMGGSMGNGGYAPPYKQTNCERLTLDASINSPTAAISQLKLGVAVDLTPNQGTTSSVLVHYQGQLMGSLTGVKVSQLARCLVDGFNFSGEITRISGGFVIVRVKPR